LTIPCRSEGRRKHSVHSISLLPEAQSGGFPLYNKEEESKNEIGENAVKPVATQPELEHGKMGGGSGSVGGQNEQHEKDNINSNIQHDKDNIDGDIQLHEDNIDGDIQHDKDNVDGDIHE
jgi:hypothetical protein